LDWDKPRTGTSNWANIVAAIETDPLGGVIHRATDPDNWHWYVPGVDESRRVAELLIVANLQRAGDKARSKLQSFKPAKRPWDEQPKKLTMAKMTPEEFEAELLERRES